MPHATGDDTMDGVDEGNAVVSFLNEYGDGERAGHERAFDQRGKADDAQDFEDISDDDLPEEEVAQHQLSDDTEGNNPYDNLGGFGSVPAQQRRTNGYHVSQDATNQNSSDLFDDNDDTQELFGDGSSSPEQERTQPSSHAHPPPRPGGLALPSKSSLALPGINTSYQRPYRPPPQQSPESMSPTSSTREDGYSPAESFQSDETDEAGMSQLELDQRRLLRNAARRQRGEEVVEAMEDVNMDVFYNLFPRFETNQNPNFVDLFHPREVTYRGKIPFKQPRAVQASKPSLDLLPDQEKSFRAPVFTNKGTEVRGHQNGLIYFNRGSEQDASDDDLAWSAIDENERIGGVTMQDLAIVCGDWDVASADHDAQSVVQEDLLEGEYEAEERARSAKKQKIGLLENDFSYSLQDPQLSFEEPERTIAKLAKSIALDMNDPNLLIDELVPQQRRRGNRIKGDARRDGAYSKDIARRYNISNDEAYDLLKENHQHKVRSTLGSLAIEHSLPAVKLQWPFYEVALSVKEKRNFHRAHLDMRDKGREYRVQKLKHVKRKHIRGREIKDIFKIAEDLYLGDNASVALFEYSEEVPIMMSNFGMGNRLINYYRKKDADDQERPKREIGETQVLLTQDKSPFANFGHVDRGEVVPTLQNGMYRAPVFQHKAKSTDFLVGISSTYESGHRFYLRNVENLHTVGQQFPLAEVPTRSSRKVTDAAKKRLRALSFRIYRKSIDPSKPRAKPLSNESIIPHLPGHDLQQTRSKMREFMKYERAPGKDSGGVWVPDHRQTVPEPEVIRTWIKPEDICLLDSMQVGVQHLTDLGLPVDKKEGQEDNELDENESVEQQLAPWETTKNFLGACQGKSMLKLHGEGDPTGRGEGFSFVRTSMKGGFQALGESAQDKIEAKKRRENGGHSYNVAKQQQSYDADIRMIWNKQKESLAAELEMSDVEDEDAEDGQSAYPSGRGATPRSTFGTPAAFSRRDDESTSQFSKGSVERGDKMMTITRKTIDMYGKVVSVYERVTNPRVIASYRARKLEKLVNQKSIADMNPTDDPELNAKLQRKIEIELARIGRNADRRVAREKQKKGGASSPAAAGSPGQSEADAAGTEGTPQKPGRGRNKDGTARKCANCGQVGHIKTNRKSVSRPFQCLICEYTEYTDYTFETRPIVRSTSLARGSRKPGSRDSGRR